MAFCNSDSLFDIETEEVEPLELFCTNIYGEYGGKSTKKYNPRTVLPT